MSGKASKKTWQIITQRRSGNRDRYFIRADDLYAAFIRFRDAFSLYDLVELRISEVKQDEEKEEKPGTGVS